MKVDTMEEIVKQHQFQKKSKAYECSTLDRSLRDTVTECQ